MSAPLIVVVGPTASGKSDLAMWLATQHSGEIICADSRTIYAGMDIGTAKPSIEMKRKVPHFLLDVVRPGERFTAADFKERTTWLLEKIHCRNKLPIIVGGTGLYVDSVIFDYKFGPTANPARRAELEAMSVEDLQAVCRDNGVSLPQNLKNKRHLIRAIELGGLLVDEKKLRGNTLILGLSVNKDELRGRIENRVRAMLNVGVIDEAKALAARYGWDNEAMKSNIYRAARDHLERGTTEEEFVAAVVKADASLAKRQLTWFKRNPYIRWGSPEELKGLAAKFIQAISQGHHSLLQ